jgi:hypothetical protein
VFREEDLIKLISILVTDCDISRIRIDHELPDLYKSCWWCGKILIYPNITSIIIDNKNNFEVNYNSFYVQMQTEFNISLQYLLKN